MPEKEQEHGRNVIIVSCITGTGSARRIREWLLRFPDIATNSEIIPVGLKDNIHEIAEKLGNRLKMIIGFIDPEIHGVPFIGMEQVTNQEGINRVQLILKGWRSSAPEASWTEEDLPLSARFEQIRQSLSYFAPSIDPEHASAQADFILRSLKRICTGPLHDDLQIRIYVHIVTMFERLHSQEPMPMPEDEAGLLNRYKVFFEKLTNILEIACKNLDLTFSISEAYYFLLALPVDEIL